METDIKTIDHIQTKLKEMKNELISVEIGIIILLLAYIGLLTFSCYQFNNVKEMIMEETTVMTDSTPNIPHDISTKPVIEPISTEIKEVSVDLTPVVDNLELLACAIYNEAGGDACSDLTRKRVADVILNRVEDSRFPDTIYQVLTAPGQYANFHNDVVWPERANNPNEAHAVERAYRIAEEVLSGNHSDLYGQGYIWQANFKQGTDIIYADGTYFGR